MVALEISHHEHGHVVVKGDLSFAHIHKKIVKAIDFGHSRYSHEVNIDLSEVNQSDSAGLALMIEWIKLSKLHNTKVSFSHIPEQLLTLAKLSGLEDNEYFIK
ncbi:MAG: STAS domain-containing protein [Methylococcales bacterium]|nr:STAS domain-containing protein [Methylococcales bacterium]